jgi:trafficking protein particle complex subunit 10
MVVKSAESDTSPLSFISISSLQLLFKLYRPIEVATRGYAFVIAFSKTLALHEVSIYDFTVFFLYILLCIVMSKYFFYDNYAHPLSSRTLYHFVSVKYGW